MDVLARSTQPYMRSLARPNCVTPSHALRVRAPGRGFLILMAARAVDISSMGAGIDSLDCRFDV